MEPSADVQAIISKLNQIPAAVASQVAAQVAAAEAAKDAQRATDVSAFSAAVDSVTTEVEAPPAQPDN